MLLDVPDELVDALTMMLTTKAKKKADYGDPEQPWANLHAVAHHLNVPLYVAADIREVEKLERIRTLRNREPANETLEDTYLDKANFALFAYALFLKSQVAGGPLPAPEHDR